jgi:hypothetical protein
MVDDLKSQLPDLRSDLRFEVVSNVARKSLYYPSMLDQRRAFRADVAKIAGVADQRAIPKDRKLVGFVGRVENSKGLRLLEELAAAHASGQQPGDGCLLVQFRFQPGSAEHEACMKMQCGCGKEIRTSSGSIPIRPRARHRSADTPF